MAHKMIKTMFILSAVALIVLAGVLYVANSLIGGPLKGTPVELDVISLKDNDNYDYMDAKVVKGGTGDYRAIYGNLAVYLDNDYRGDNDNEYMYFSFHEGVNYYSSGSETFPEGEIVRFYFLENVVDAGKTYYIKIRTLLPAFSGVVVCT